MIRTIALALTVAAISTGAAAQCSQDGRSCGPAKIINIPSATAQATAPIAAAIPAAPRSLSWTEECVLLAVAQGPLPVAPGALRQITEYCAAQSPAPPTPTQPATTPEISTTLKDACVVKALGRLPQVDGMRVTQSSYKFFKIERDWVVGTVSVSIEVRSHQAHYNWFCSVDSSGLLVLTAKG